MKKFLNAVKANKTLLIVLAVILVLVTIVVIFYGNDERQEQNSSGKSQDEIKLEAILSSIEGVGDNQVYINESEQGIDGVVIVCSGANNIMTRNNILNVVSTALNVEKNIIAIFAMN